MHLKPQKHRHNKLQPNYEQAANTHSKTMVLLLPSVFYNPIVFCQFACVFSDCSVLGCCRKATKTQLLTVKPHYFMMPSHKRDIPLTNNKINSGLLEVKNGSLELERQRVGWLAGQLEHVGSDKQGPRGCHDVRGQRLRVSVV